MQRVLRQSAFTLIEIMSVIVIMGIIAALLVLAARGARQRAALDAAKAGVSYIADRIEAYRSKRGELPPDLSTLPDYTTEMEIYQTLNSWGFTVTPQKQVDPWGNPYIIVLQGDYGTVFPIATGTSGYNGVPFGKMGGMYVPGGIDQAKEVHSGDPLTTSAYLDEANSFQVISAGPDGLISRDNREETQDIDGDGASVNADNIRNW